MRARWSQEASSGGGLVKRRQLVRALTPELIELSNAAVALNMDLRNKKEWWPGL